MRIKVYGARGSNPVSTTPQRVDEILKTFWEHTRECKDWDAVQEKLSTLPRHQYQVWGGNTTCIELESDVAPMPVYFDAGTGITAAGLDPLSSLNEKSFSKGNGKVAIFFTHTHWDHIIGLVSLEQLYKGNRFHFYGVHKKLEERLSVLFQEAQFPVPYHMVEPNFQYHQIPLNTPIQLGGLNIHHCPQTHPGGSFAYRVSDGKSTFVLATDTELKNVDPPHMDPGANVYSNADVLVLDAQFSPEDFPSRQGYGHSQIFTAVDFAVRENAKHLVLFHQAPEYNDAMLDRQLERARRHLSEKHPSSGMTIEMALEGTVIDF